MLNNENKQGGNQKAATNASRQDSSNASSNPLPAISLPKGGGAIRGIGEKFAANPVTGTGSLTVPIYTSPGRSGFGPQLSLSYDSGAGNGPFGFGWSLALPSLTRKTDKGLPQYMDAEESDTFILSGAEDLVPLLVENNGQWVRDETPRTVYGKQYSIHRYRPRVEGLFARIEHWVNLSDPQDTFWRSISKDNVTTWYGKTSESRIADPSDPARVFTWLICESYDDKGNVITYQYKSENSDGVDLSQAHERNRSDTSRSANHYLKHVFYGNRTPYFPNLKASEPVPLPTDCCFELVFDYGEHDDQVPVPQETGKPWDCRADPFSAYRATFEVRTYRLCRRALMFHHFASELDVGLNCLVRSTDFTHAQAAQSPPDPTRPFYSFLLSVTQTGYRRNAVGSYLSKALPPLEFAYTEAVIDETVQEIDPESLENLPYGLDGTHYQWVDLDGEGLSGILTEQADSWFYKPNLSPVNLHTENGVQFTLAQFGPVETVARKPSLAALQSGRQQLLDLAGDGHLDLVQFDGPTPGFFERTEEESWESFTPFASLPVLDWQNPNLKFVDLTGDGHADLLISQDDAFWWHTSLAAAGFGPGQRVQQALDEEKGPKLVFADGTESIFLADVSGDGLTDLVRIRNGEVCYWPNLGYGRFGARVTMDQSPWFESPDLFDGRRIRLADIDGSGTADIVYFASGSVHLYFNQSGNAWGERRVLSQFPLVESVSSATALDLLGNGTACLAWSSPLPGNARQPMRYIDLMGGQKPHLLIRVTNNLGAETRVQYAPSTRFYVADKLAGTPWLTRIPFPVHVVERVETRDDVSETRLVTTYSYHHGYYDGFEREFRGFGRVDQLDAESFDQFKDHVASPADQRILEEDLYVPPVLTRTWFHTGAYIDRQNITRQFSHEYYQGDPQSPSLPDTTLPTGLTTQDGTVLPRTLTSQEEEEACRSLKGKTLRQEVYAENDTSAPYTVSEHTYVIIMLQPVLSIRYGVFYAYESESLDLHYEQHKDDPRASHTLTLRVDTCGNVRESASIGYPRRTSDPDRPEQSQLLMTSTRSDVINVADKPDFYRIGVPSETYTYEITSIPYPPPPAVTTSSNPPFPLLSSKDVADGIQSAQEIAYEAGSAGPVDTTGGPVQKRLIENVRTVYWKDDLSGPLPLGQVASHALLYESYKLAFTPGLLQAVYLQTAANSPVSNGQLDSNALLGILENEGKYMKGGKIFVANDWRDDAWWVPSGRTGYDATKFYLSTHFTDPFGNTSTITYDDYILLVTQVADALPTSQQNIIQATNSYRTMQPVEVTDPNGNRSRVVFDALGMVVGIAVMGKVTENKGDSLDGFVADLDDAVVQAHLKHPLTNPQEILGTATTRFLYDPLSYYNNKALNTGTVQPVVAYTLTRETHESDLAGQQTNYQHSFLYINGSGHEVMKKIQAEPGLAPYRDANGAIVRTPDNQPDLKDTSPAVRWVGTGRTIYDNKGNPVKKYEPFFDSIPAYVTEKDLVEWGVTPILRYDPLGRLIRTDNPDGTFSTIAFDAWQQTTSDENDTVLESQWYADRGSPKPGNPEPKDPEARAAWLAAAHANTPTIAYFDPLGRSFLTIADNGPDGHYQMRITLDIEGNQRIVTDALKRKALANDFDMLSHTIHTVSIDAGERWILQTVVDTPLRQWNSRGFQLSYQYDALHRPTQVYMQAGTQTKLLVEQRIYGESVAHASDSNLKTKLYQVYDGAGVVTNDPYDFKGNLLSSSRQLVQDYHGQPDWSSIPVMGETFQTSTMYDALNRPTSVTTPDNSVIFPTYNEANLLERVDVRLPGATSTTSFVKNFDYNARGQRVLVEHASGVSTTYEYDPETFRMVRLQTKRPADAQQDFIQDLEYTFDPVGNITTLQDHAQQTIFFNNAQVAPNMQYVYDALNRLTSARGREHIGQASNPHPADLKPEYDYQDFLRINLPHPSDWQAMRNYTEEYHYDEVGNIWKLVHTPDGNGNGSWTRLYTYEGGATTVNGPTAISISNHLQSTSFGDPNSNPLQLLSYKHDLAGNMIQMPHLQNMQYNFKDQLQQVDLGGGGTAYYRYDANGQRVRKVVQSGSLIKERIYIGGYEVYRERNGGGLQLERETLHIMDDKRRIALVETKKVDTQDATDTNTPLIRYQMSNHLDSAALELDATGAVISYEEYYPYGGTSYQAGRSLVEVSLKRYRYTGKERDKETGLYYNGARYYASWLGRWVSCDPKGLVDGANLYKYAKGNPQRFVDPSGLAADEPGNKQQAELQALQQKFQSSSFEEKVKLATEHNLKISPTTGTLVQDLPKGTSKLIEASAANKAFEQATERTKGIPTLLAATLIASAAVPLIGVALYFAGAAVLPPIVSTGRFVGESIVESAVVGGAVYGAYKGYQALKGGATPNSSTLIGSNTASFRRDAEALIANTKDHPLKFLLDETGHFKPTKGLKHSELFERPDLVQMGHIESKKSGQPERIVLQGAWENQSNNITIEHPGKKGSYAENTAIDIGRVAVETRTAIAWEKYGYIPAGTVAHAKKLAF